MELPTGYALAQQRITKIDEDGETGSSVLFDYRDVDRARIKKPHTFRLSACRVAAGDCLAIEGWDGDQVIFVLEGSGDVSQGSERTSVKAWDCVALAAGERTEVAAGSGPGIQFLLLTPDPAVYRKAGRAPCVRGKFDATRVARWGEVTGYDDAFITGRTPGFEKKVYKLVNRGVSTDSHVIPALPHHLPFTVTLVQAEADKGAALHAHATEEVFLPLDGALDVHWGDEAQHAIRLGRHELASMPTTAMRGFRNANGRRFHLLVMLGGWNEDSLHSVKYHPDQAIVA